MPDMSTDGENRELGRVQLIKRKTCRHKTSVGTALKTVLPECPLAINIKSNSIKSSVKNSDLPWRAAGGQPATPHSP